ncbi:MAG: PIN domain-containing protein [Candidatus Aminicenantes bacterium]
MNILFDTNVILDVLLERGDFLQESVALFNHVELAEINGFISASSIATIYYIAQKAFNRKKAEEEIELLTEIFGIAPVDKTVIVDALKLGFKDFEDAIIHESAGCINADAIVTRNVRDFKKAKIKVHSPNDLLNSLRIQALIDQDEKSDQDDQSDQIPGAEMD